MKEEETNNLLDNVINFLNWSLTNWNITDVFTVVLAFLTALLAYFTFILAREAKKTREENLAPNIVVTIEPSNVANNHAVLVIQNVGNGVAYDVNVIEKAKTIIKEEVRINGSDYILNDLAFMKLKVLKPNQKIEHSIGQFINLPVREFKFDISMKNSYGKRVICSNQVDVNCYYDAIVFNEKKIDDLVKILDKINKSINNLAPK